MRAVLPLRASIDDRGWVTSAEEESVVDLVDGEPSRRAFPREVRWLLLSVLLLVLSQAAVGMAVNLFVTIPQHHPGAVPSDYFSGSASSVGWALSHGAAALAAHAALGIVLVILSLVTIVRSVRVPGRTVTVAAALGSVLIIGAGFNGASFLDYGHDVSSLIMALLALAAAASYGVGLCALAAR